MKSVFAIIALLLLATPVSAVNVVCTVPDFVPIVKAVGGGVVNVSSVMPPGSDPHAFSISMDTMNSLKKADLIVLANSKLLHFEEKIKENYKNCIDFEDYAAFGAKLDSFPGYSSNPHGYWLKFENGIAIARAIEVKLSRLSPDYAWYFHENLKEFEREVNEARETIKSISVEDGMEGRKCVAVVPGVCYIIQNCGMSVGSVLLGEGLGFASGKEFANIEEKLKNSEYTYIVVPEFMKNSKAGEIAEQISSDTGKPVIYVKFVMAGENDTYTGLQYFNALRLLKPCTQQVKPCTPMIVAIALAVLAAVAALTAIFAVLGRRRI